MQPPTRHRSVLIKTRRTPSSPSSPQKTTPITTEQFIRDIISLQPAMRRMAGRLLHDDDLAADAVQETFAHLWKHRWKLGRARNPQGFCMTSLRNQCVDMMRQMQPLVPLSALEDDPPAEYPQEEPDALSERELRYQHLEEAIASLAPQQQEILRLKYVEQRSSREIAQITGLTESNVNTIMSRTYAELRKRLTD